MRAFDFSGCSIPNRLIIIVTETELRGKVDARECDVNSIAAEELPSDIAGKQFV